MIPRESGYYISGKSGYYISGRSSYYSGFYCLPIDDYFKNPSVSTDTSPIEEEEKRSSFCDKNIVRLPARKEYIHDWEKLGVIWQEALTERVMVASALLPKGWSLKKIDRNFSHLIDLNQLVRAKIFIKDTIYDFEASASFS